MLEHSRGAEGERRSTDVNALLEEYVNLAFHGMRAQQSEFNCALERSYDPAAGSIEMVPQEMGRVLINLLNNALDAMHGRTVRQLRIEARRGHWNGQVIGVGTGFFVSEDGMILTAYHVVDASNTTIRSVHYVAVTSDERVYRLELVGFDRYLDLAALRAKVDRKVPYLTLADHTPSSGTPVVAIGNSREDFLAPRAGRITRLGVQASRADFADDTIELTNSLAPGDSGGPVVNNRAEVVGVVSFISFNPGAMSTQSFIPPFLQGLSLTREFASYAVPLTADSEAVAAVVSGEARDWPVIGFSWAQNDYRPGVGPHDFGPRPGPVVAALPVGSVGPCFPHFPRKAPWKRTSATGSAGDAGSPS